VARNETGRRYLSRSSFPSTGVAAPVSIIPSNSFASALNRPVYAIDLRNHGHSPSLSPHNYPTMAADLSHFFRSRELQDVQLLGHSMGGKAVMTYALSEEMQKEDRLGKLVVVDIAPSSGTISAEFREYVAAMKRVDGLGLKTRKEAQAALKEIEPVCPFFAFRVQ
jgi:pimeloyl-ACP methyl ester carboxylesterase